LGKARRQESILPWVSLLSVGHTHIWMVVVCLTGWTWLHVVSNVGAILVEIASTAYHLILILVLNWLVTIHIILILVNLILVYKFTSWHTIWISYLLKRDVTKAFFIVNLIYNITVNVGHYLWLLDITRTGLLLLLVDDKAVYR